MLLLARSTCSIGTLQSWAVQKTAELLWLGGRWVITGAAKLGQEVERGLWLLGNMQP